LRSQKRIEDSIRKIPIIYAVKLNGEPFSTDSANFFKDQLVVINYFNSSCDHCQNMAREMLVHKYELHNLRWLMFTTEQPEIVRQFSDSFHLEQLPSVTILCDTSFSFSKGFGLTDVPSFYVFKKGKLIKKNIGECNINYLIK
jgi:thiol-disulfide isomerase/thioredoxin